MNTPHNDSRRFDDRKKKEKKKEEEIKILRNTTPPIQKKKKNIWPVDDFSIPPIRDRNARFALEIFWGIEHGSRP